MIRWSDVDASIPQPGWPGRRRAIALAVAKVAGGTVFLVVILAVLLGALLLGAAGADGLGPR